MRKQLFLSFFLYLVLLASSTCRDMQVAYGTPLDEDHIRDIEINRALIAKAEEEYASSLKALREQPDSEMMKRKLTGTEYKLRALREDGQKLSNLPPRESKAYEFIEDLLVKKMPSPVNLHEKALEMVAKKNLPEAVKVYEDIVLTHPDDDEAYVIMGHSYLLMGDYQKAEMAFANAVHIDASNLSEITPFYENTVLENPDDDIAFCNLGFAWLIVGDFGRAKNAFEEALEINPENILAQQGLLFSANRNAVQ